MADRDASTLRVLEELKRLYKTKILPFEQLYRYDLFHSPPLTDAEFDSKPQVMLIGQYSVGKTSFIRYLLGRDFPGQRIGPEPTTDRFVAVLDGPDERIIPGNALAVAADMPYRGLERFGVSFLNRFEGVSLPSQVLRKITLIDTPGVLSGEKQRVARGYDFTAVCSWFAARADLIFLLFDAHKLDISDEFRSVIESLRGNDDKIRCILNKADQIDRQRLMRVYGALMWSIGKVVKTPEVLRVYVGSFWDQPLMYQDNAALFEMEEKDLMNDLKSLPCNNVIRKINELVKRVRIAKVHCFILSYLREQMPMLMGHSKKQKQLIAELPSVFRTVMKKHNLSPGDFPDLDDFKFKLSDQDFTKFHHVKQKLLDDVQSVLTQDFPRLMEALPRVVSETDASVNGGGIDITYGHVSVAPDVPGWSDGASENPFKDSDIPWSLQDYVEKYFAVFETISEEGFVSGAKAKVVLSGTGLSTGSLRKIWDLSDIDEDGKLDLHEFVLAMYLSDETKSGQPVPAQLDTSLIPIEKRY